MSPPIPENLQLCPDCGRTFDAVTRNLRIGLARERGWTPGVLLRCPHHGDWYWIEGSTHLTKIP